MSKKLIPLLLIFLLFSLIGTPAQAMDCEWVSQLKTNSGGEIDVSDEDYLKSPILREEYEQLLENFASYSVCLDKEIKNILSEMALSVTEGTNRTQSILTEAKSADEKIKQKLLRQEQQYDQFREEVASFNKLIERFKLALATQMRGLEGVDDELKSKLKLTANQIKKLSARLTDTDNKMDNVNNTLSDKTLYGIISILIVTLLVILLFMFLRKSVFKQRTDLNSDLEGMKKEIEEELIRLDNKLISLIESQLSIEGSKESNSGEIDHSLVLKVADEIVRIQKNTSRMDTKTKGLKQLVASVKRIQDNFSSNGYDIVEMLDQPYDEGMIASVNFILDENLNENEQVITKIIKPQVNYQGVMVQAAQIEVSQGE